MSWSVIEGEQSRVPDRARRRPPRSARASPARAVSRRGASASAGRGARAIIAAICRWQFRPWHSPIAGPGQDLDDVHVGRGRDGRVEPLTGQLLAPADHRLRRRRARRCPARPRAAARNARRNASLRAKPSQDRARALRRGVSAAIAPEVEQRAERREASFVDGDVRAGDAGAVAGRRDAVDASCGATRRARPTARRGPRRTRRRSPRAAAARRGEEAVADAERVGGDRLLRPRDGAPGGVDGRVDDLLDPPVALGAHDDPAVAERHAGAQEAECGSRAASRRRSVVAARGAAARRDDGARPGRRARPRARASRRRRNPRAAPGRPAREGRCRRRRSVCPGSTRCVLTSVWAPPAVITPGSVQPGKTTGRSCAPGARITCRASTARDCSTVLDEHDARAAHRDGAVRGSSVAPHRSAASISARPRAEVLAQRRRVVTRKPGPGCLKICPPSVGRSSTSATAEAGGRRLDRRGEARRAPADHQDVVRGATLTGDGLQSRRASARPAEPAGHDGRRVTCRPASAGSGAPIVAW